MKWLKSDTREKKTKLHRQPTALLVSLLKVKWFFGVLERECFSTDSPGCVLTLPCLGKMLPSVKPSAFSTRIPSVYVCICI